MGEVYRARDLDLDREVALKLTPTAAISPELDKALENEAKAVARLSHPHIMHINSSGILEGRRYFDTNYIRGQDLASYMRKHKPTERQAAEILIAVAEALAYAHQHGVLHRDVKPQNIYLGEAEGEGPWLIDFGLAYIRSMTDQRAKTGLCGTPGYIAPKSSPPWATRSISGPTSSPWAACYTSCSPAGPPSTSRAMPPPKPPSRWRRSLRRC
jgi:serine/threonine protein kinase